MPSAWTTPPIAGNSEQCRLDDSLLFREGLARLLAGNGFVVAAQAGDADELRRNRGPAEPAQRPWPGGGHGFLLLCMDGWCAGLPGRDARPPPGGAASSRCAAVDVRPASAGSARFAAVWCPRVLPGLGPTALSSQSAVLGVTGHGCLLRAG